VVSPETRSTTFIAHEERRRARDTDTGLTEVGSEPEQHRRGSMRSRIMQATLIAGVLTLTAACASKDDWNMWLSHNTHFASGEHGFFSMRNNKDGSNPKVYRSDIEDSRQQNWWGLYAITVSPTQIFQN
jgi:hypothetical protein